MSFLRNKIYSLLRFTEKYTKTDMVYLTKGGFWLSLGQVFNALGGFLTLYIFSTFAPQHVFGTYQYVLSIVSVLYVFALPGIATALTRAFAKGVDGVLIRAIRMKLLWGISASILSLLLALYYFINSNDLLAGSFLIVSFFLPTMGAFQLYRSVLNGRKMFRRVAQFDIISRIFSVCLMGIVLFLTNNLVIIIFSYFLFHTLLRGSFLFYTLRALSFNKINDTETFSYAKHLSFMGILAVVAAQFDKILVFHYLGAVELAVYIIALTPVDQLRSIVGIIRTIAFPKLSAQSAAVIKKTLLKKILRLELLIIPVIALYITCIPFLIRHIFPQYIDAIIYSQVLIFYLLFSPRSLITTALKAQMKTKELYIIRILGPLFRMIILFPLLKFFGLWGAVWGLLISELFLYILYYLVFRRI
ncbi:MAG: oligosaccharide flippase family protein [Candidatus Magasanikbacteria bacterium]|jgi:O-antigen/teichoic acid export membrane protein|nr:oligosaccharide flippase family protein [Candidatus Magasanikbacteria bacterium]MBT4221230.1 oligosaccharide flippase family protein [Candidatus Magasanikbacteria bacterium]MBT4350659.1 oligosaccharide flippase family protein [Candidatus Magasanikbacteria bacterium]MBT4541341.1 oligosaccharide flippase family protein [Candidatus Magasanikbacteria bacterium]MBT6253075.1 oligosaccharide flippase family protein [Candidatus Magasanikbacteria bacterium]